LVDQQIVTDRNPILAANMPTSQALAGGETDCASIALN
jgi:hypothetical protein